MQKKKNLDYNLNFIDKYFKRDTTNYDDNQREECRSTFYNCLEDFFFMVNNLNDNDNQEKYLFYTSILSIIKLITDQFVQYRRKSEYNIIYYKNFIFNYFIKSCIEILFIGKFDENNNVMKITKLFNPSNFIKYLEDNEENITIFNKQINSEYYKSVITKIFAKLEKRNNYELLNIALKLKEYNYYNFDKLNINMDYNFLDFIIAFSLFYTNINDFNKTSFYEAEEDKDKNMNEVIDNKILKYNLYTLVESNDLNFLFNHDDKESENLDNRKLSISVLMKCKKIIYTKQFADDMVLLYIDKDLIDIIILNFLVNFEKMINYILKKNNISEQYFGKKIEKCYDNKLAKSNKCFYDIEYFVSLFYYIYKKEEIANTNENFKDMFELKKSANIITELKNLENILTEKQHNDLIKVPNTQKNIFTDVLINKNIANIKKFIKIIKILFKKNNKINHFSYQPHNRLIKNSDNDFYNTLYNKSYISFKKAYDFVKDFNDLADYFCSVFNDLTIKNINHSMDNESKKLKGDDVFAKIYSIFNDQSQLDYDYFKQTKNLPHIIIEKTENGLKEEKKKYLNVKKLKQPYDITKNEPNILILLENNKYSFNSDFIKSFIEKTPIGKDFYFCPDFTLDVKANYGQIYEFFKQYFKDCIKKNLEYNKQKLETNYKLNNFYLYYYVTDDNDLYHASCIIINYDENYIDIYNSHNHYSDSSIYIDIYNSILKFFYEDYNNVIINILKELGLNYDKIFEINNIDYFDSMVKFQSNFDGKSFRSFCQIYTLIYSFIRLLYFNKSCYSMNYIQEKICEYIMSYNHPVYFLTIFVFLFMIRSYQLNSNVIYNIDQIKKEKIYKNSLFNDKDIYIFRKYSELFSNENLIKIHNDNFNKIFRPLNKKENKKYNVNTNINSNFEVKNYNIF